MESDYTLQKTDMSVEELIEKLQKLPQNLPVYVNFPQCNYSEPIESMEVVKKQEDEKYDWDRVVLTLLGANETIDKDYIRPAFVALGGARY